MPDYVPAPTYQNYAGFLSNLIGGLPTDYRNAQQQQTQIDVSNALKGGVEMNPDGTPNWAAMMNKFAQAGGSAEAAALGPQTQQQAWQRQAQTMSPMLGGGAGTPAAPPSAAPMQPPAATPPAPAAAPPQPSGGPTLTALVSSVAPDPAQNAKVTGFLAKVLGVGPTAPLSPDQVARAQRIMAAAKLGPSGPGQLAAPVNWDAMPGQGGPTSPAAASAPRDQTAAFADMSAKETAAGYNPGGLLTEGQATAIATGGAPGTPFGLPPAAESVWKRMVPQESGGSQFNPDGSVVTSPKGAVGIAQVMPETGPAAAKLAGLPWDPVRFKNDPNYNLALGRAYYAQQVQAFGSPDVAAAAYNAGPRAVLSAQAKATNRGGSYLDYLPAETRDYVAKVTGGGGAPVAQGAQGGGRPIVPQVPLPAGFSQGQEQQAILAIRQEAAKYASIPGAAGKGMADALNKRADEIETSIAPIRAGPSETILPAQGGAPLYQGAFVSGGGTGGMTPQEIDAAADIWHQTGKFPQGMGSGMQGRAVRSVVMNRALEMHPEDDPSELPKRWQEFAAQGVGLGAGARTEQTREKNLQLILRAANAAIPAALEASEKVSRTGWVPINQLVQNGEVIASDPDLKRFGMANLQLAEHWARAMNPTGVMRESDRDKALSFLNTADSKETYRAAVMQLKTQIEREYGAVRGVGGGSDQPMPTADQSAPGGGASGQPARVTKEQYDALPKGTPFIAVDDPTQTPRTKP